MALKSFPGGPQAASPAPPLLWGVRPGVLPGSPFPPGVRVAMAGLEAGPPALLPAERALLGPDVPAARLTEFALGRHCARMALAALHPPAGETPVGRADGRAPRWPEGFVGAITHRRGHAAAAAAPAGRFLGLGIDLEGARPLPPRLRRRVLRPEELAALPPGSAGEAAAMLLFSAKESLFKALHPLTGVYLGFQDATVQVRPGGGAQTGEATHPAGGPGERRHGSGELPETEEGGGTLTWTLHKDCGPRWPVGSSGVGGFRRAGALVLTGVWLENG